MTWQSVTAAALPLLTAPSSHRKTKHGVETDRALQKLRPSCWWNQPQQVNKGHVDKRRRYSYWFSENLNPPQRRECLYCIAEYSDDEDQASPVEYFICCRHCFRWETTRCGLLLLSRKTYWVWISIGVWSNMLQTVESPLDTSTGPNMIDRMFCMDYGTIILSLQPLPAEERQEHEWYTLKVPYKSSWELLTPCTRLTWTCQESSRWCSFGHILHRPLNLLYVPSECNLVPQQSRPVAIK